MPMIGGKKESKKDFSFYVRPTCKMLPISKKFLSFWELGWGVEGSSILGEEGSYYTLSPFLPHG